MHRKWLAGLVKKLFNQEVPPSVIAEAVQAHLKEVASADNSNSAAAAGGNSAKREIETSAGGA